MSVALISGPYFSKLVHLSVLSILSQGLEFIYLSPGPDFIDFESGSGSRSYHGNPEGESGSEFYQFFSPSSGPDFIHRVRVRVQILSIFESGTGPDFIKHVRSASGSGFSQHPRVGAAYILVFVPVFSKCLRMRNFSVFFICSHCF